MNFSNLPLALAVVVVLTVLGWAVVALLRRSIPLLSHPAWQGVGAVAGIVIGIITLLLPIFDATGSVTLTVRVADSNNAAVPGARLLLFMPGVPLSEITDSNGVATFTLQSPSATTARLFVETQQYAIYDQIVQLSGNPAIDVRLTPRDSNNRDIIVRAVDDLSGNPIGNATVNIVASGDILSQVTDTSGFAKFTLVFSSDTVDADISVSTPNGSQVRQQVTLHPDQVQYIRVNASTGALTVTMPDVPPDSTLVYGQVVTSTIASPAQADRYTFTASAEDIIEIRVVVTSGILWPRLRLFSPDGSSQEQGGGNSYTGEVTIETTLSAAGTYIVIVSNFQGDRTGTYDLHVLKIN